MPSFQQTTVLGHAGRDAEMRFQPSGDGVASFSVAVSYRWKKGGEEQEHTEWFNVVAFKKTAEYVGKYVKKGALVFVQGRLQTNEYKDKSGVERRWTDLIADKVMVMDRKPAEKVDPMADLREDIPF